jgi:hypothetical protein
MRLCRRASRQKKPGYLVLLRTICVTMKVHTLLRMGTHHTNHCEDYVVVESLGPGRLLCAVMDGCTMGTDSYFAATLVGKVLRKIATEKNYQSFYENSGGLAAGAEVKEILRALFTELKHLKGRLLLREDELLTTLLLGVLDTDAGAGQVMVIGDGLVSIDGQLAEYEQDNRPDYLGYHLGEDFEAWYARQTQVIDVSHFSDLSLASDGIFTFAPYDKRTYHGYADPVAYLLTDRQDEGLPTMLQKKFTFLEQQCGVQPTDDIGIVRIVK